MDKSGSHYNDEYAKRIKAYYKNKDRKIKQYQDVNKKPEKTFFDKLFLRIFLSSLLLLVIVGSERCFNQLKINLSLQNQFNTNLNILKIVNFFKGTPLAIIPDDDVISVYEPNIYDKVEYKDGVNIINNESFAGVTNLVSGYVSRIKKTGAGYSITVKSIDGLEYEYFELESIDYHIYEYIKAGEIIGKAKYQADYEFKLIISDQNGVYSFYEKAD